MLEAAQRQGRYRQVMHHAVNAYRVLILDDIGHLPMTREQANLFYQVVAQRSLLGDRLAQPFSVIVVVVAGRAGTSFRQPSAAHGAL